MAPPDEQEPELEDQQPVEDDPGMTRNAAAPDESLDNIPSGSSESAVRDNESIEGG